MTGDEGKRVRVLIVDDSAMMRALLTHVLGRDPDIEVVGEASDPLEAREKIKALNPDVITLDVEMPKMDGLTFLRNLMRLRPMPVVMISTLTERGAEVTLAALEIGAVDFMPKPKVDVASELERCAELIAEKVKAAARAQLRDTAALRTTSSHPTAGLPRITPLSMPVALPVSARPYTTDRLIAIGASTGGTEAIAALLSRFPADAPPVVMTQHIPEVFSERFAARLDRECALTVSEARDGDPVLPGRGYVAPGGRHLRVVRSGGRLVCRLGDDEPVNRHRPSVDVLFRSVAEQVGRDAVAALLTGMGVDGAKGLLHIREAGGATLAQDKSSCVVFGMPAEALRIGAATEALSLTKMARRLLELAGHPAHQSR